MTCHLVKVENNLGRSTVIDLSSKSENKFRQIDHRTIQWIIFKNVKYILKKGGKKVDREDEEEEKKAKKGPLWDTTKLEVGNFFSHTDYFKVKAINGNNITTTADSKEIVISKDILEHEMYNASVYTKEERLPLTQIVKLLKEANSVVFTVNYNLKVDDKLVKEKLSKLTQKELSDPKALAKELLSGNEKTLVGRLSKTEGKLGRSLVVTLPEKFYGQIDHRTINWMILKNIKYIVK